jgi:uncharacterized protein YbjT (DUF2867 family)
LEAGYPVRVLVRDPDCLRGRAWLEKVEVFQGDAFQPATLLSALQGIDVAYYLIHSLHAGSDYAALDLTAARNFGDAARAADVQRIIYLGALGDPATKLSPHLRSRQETGAALREAGVPVTEFRAGIIIGSGSGSFELIRHLTERLPLLICPPMLLSRVQPIAVKNVLDYLVAVLQAPASVGRTIEIGGADVLTYGDTLLRYARARGLRRKLLPVRFLSPRLAAMWCGVLTPVSFRIAKPLFEGLHSEVVVRDNVAQELFPQIQLLDYQTALLLALAQLHPAQVDTVWIDAQAAPPGAIVAAKTTIAEGMHIDRHYRTIAARPTVVCSILAGLGGEMGWLYANWAWRLRGFVDHLLGGGRYGRSCADPHDIRVGDTLDFMRVEAMEPGQLVRLRDEYNPAGNFWLQWEAQLLPDGRTRMSQTVFFAPKGLLGLAYWFLFSGLHARIFSGLLREIGREAEACGVPEGPSPR